MIDNKTMDDLWKGLMDSESIFGRVSNGGNYSYNDDDSEEFLTSKEINPKDDKSEKHLGLVGTSDGVIEEDVYFKRYKTNYEHKYTEKELEAMRASCVGTIVHDYSENDLYHMSDEYRRENDMLSEISDKLQRVRGTYRKVDAWIEAMRTVVQAWELLEERGNYIHTKQEFFEMVASGKIVSNRLMIPKLKKMNNYDIDILIKYISNPELDASELLPVDTKTVDDFYAQLDDDYEEESPEEQMARLLSPEEIEYINNHIDNPDKFRVKDIKHKLIKGYDKKTYSIHSKKKKKKKNKVEEYRIESLHDILNKIQNDPNNHSEYGYSRSYMVANSMFEPIEAPKNFLDEIRFEGSWANDDDIYMHDLALREEMLKQHTARNKYTTYGDQELQQFFKLLEENGVNTIDLRRKMDVPTDGGSKAIEEKATKKENKKMESAIIQRITKLNNSDKFKKLVSKAENALNKQFNEY